jgi:hypothetical protein
VRNKEDRVKKREYYRTILQHGASNIAYEEAVEWWKAHRGKDFTKHYKVGNWIKSAHSIAFVKGVVHGGELRVIRFWNETGSMYNDGVILGDVAPLRESSPFYPIYPKEFITTPREDRGPGVWEFVLDNPDNKYHGNRSLVYGELVGNELHGTLIQADYYATTSPLGGYSTTWTALGYKPVNMEIKL